MKRPASLGVYVPKAKILEPQGAKGVEFSQPLMRSLENVSLGFYCGSYGAMYRKQPAVRAVVDFLARNIAQLNGKVYQRVSDTDRLEDNTHPLATILRNPNPATTRYNHMFATVADVAIYDRAYWRIMSRGSRTGVVRLSPAKLSIDYNEQTGRNVYRLVDGTEVTRDELVIFHGYSPDTDDEGISALETLRRVLQEELANAQARVALQVNAARASGFLSRPADAPALSDGARTRIRSDIDMLLAGPSNAGKVALLEEGMRWDTPSFDAHFDDYVSSRRLTYEEVAITYFGPIGGRAWLDATTQTASEEAHRQMYQDVLGPWLRYLQDEIELQLLPKLQRVGYERTYFEFNLADKLKGSFEEQARIATTATGVPSVSVNETRARMNLPRIDDATFDLPVMPLNVMYGGQPAETIPVADPSTPAPPELMAASASLVDILHRYFDRQQVSLTSPRARVASRDRWDRELADDLTPFLFARSTEVAQAINAETWAMLDAVNESPSAVKAVLVMSRNVRAGQLAAALTAA